MSTYTVHVTKLQTYEVEANDRNSAVQTALVWGGSARAELLEEEVLKVTAEREGEFVQVRFLGQRSSSRYTYKVPDGLDVEVGDCVIVPVTPFTKVGGVEMAEVTVLGSSPDYVGAVKTILGKLIQGEE